MQNHSGAPELYSPASHSRFPFPQLSWSQRGAGFSGDSKSAKQSTPARKSPAGSHQSHFKGHCISEEAASPPQLVTATCFLAKDLTTLLTLQQPEHSMGALLKRWLVANWDAHSATAPWRRYPGALGLGEFGDWGIWGLGFEKLGAFGALGLGTLGLGGTWGSQDKGQYPSLCGATRCHLQWSRMPAGRAEPPRSPRRPPSISHLGVDVEGQDEEGKQKVGDGEADDEIVGGGLERPLRAHAEAHQPVAPDDEQDEDDAQHQGGDVVAGWRRRRRRRRSGAVARGGPGAAVPHGAGAWSRRAAASPPQPPAGGRSEGAPPAPNFAR